MLRGFPYPRPALMATQRQAYARFSRFTVPSVLHPMSASKAGSTLRHARSLLGWRRRRRRRTAARPGKQDDYPHGVRYRRVPVRRGWSPRRRPSAPGKPEPAKLQRQWRGLHGRSLALAVSQPRTTPGGLFITGAITSDRKSTWALPPLPQGPLFIGANAHRVRRTFRHAVHKPA